jgi:phosphoglycerate dehydrogenase-like enzyme
MTRLLIFEPSYRRIASELAIHGDHLTPLLMGEDGAITLDGKPIDADDAAPDAVWANAEVFLSPAARAFMIAALKAPNLSWAQSAAAGVDHPIFRQIVEKGARLTTSHGQALGMAEYVMAGVLDYLQRGPERRAAQRAGEWSRLSFSEVMDSRWLIFGFGAIGQAVAKRGGAFGAHIVGVRRNPAPHPLAEQIIAQADVLEHLPRSDVVVMSAPITQATRNVVDAKFLAAMKEGSVIVNVGRGGLIDEAALLVALDTGRPAHAVLDVFVEEPLPKGSRFWNHPRVSLSAHASGNTPGEDQRNERLFIDNLARFIDGRPLLNEADPKDVLGG